MECIIYFKAFLKVAIGLVSLSSLNTRALGFTGQSQGKSLSIFVSPVPLENHVLLTNSKLHSVLDYNRLDEKFDGNHNDDFEDSEEDQVEAKKPLQYKTLEELEKYLYKYRKHCNDKHHKEYLNDYKYFFKAISSAFDINEVAFTCLIFKESQFDNTAFNKSSQALGLGQIRKETQKTLNGIIGSGNVSAKREAQLRKKYEKLLKQVKADPNLTPQKKQDFTYLQNIIISIDEARGWDFYFTSDQVVERMPEHYKKHATFHKVRKSPTYFSFRKLALENIAASGLYIDHMRNILKYKSEVQTFNEIKEYNDSIDHFLILAASYNTGLGNVLSRLKKNGLLNSAADEIVSELETLNSETTAHVKSIRNCAQAGNFDPPVDIRGKFQTSCQK